MSTLPYHVPLSPELQQEAGLPVAAPLAMADRVRFGELDPLNHVNNVAYLTWFESLRVRYFQLWGLTTYKRHDIEPRIVIRHAEMDWLREMVAEEDYIVTVRCIAIGTTSFTLMQELWSGGTLRATFKSVIVLLKPDGSGRMPLPQALVEHFYDIDGVARD